MSRITRIYVPLSAASLKDLAESKSLSAKMIRAYSVTDALRSTEPSSEDEESLEYAVLQEAASFAAASGWRVVGAADLDDAHVTTLADDDDRARVAIDGDVPLRRFASLHVLDPTGDRDPDADFELSWYDITELEDVCQIAD
ncbi:DUF6912 family protein [Leekyejoonella antrihumi]|uniref:Uncharacterized protein n=1 Tax=Leekyejoonella antrihumi TaxID=1660198 RepID=A0A563DY33_9MICO|nr:hypothetical protein [Leekyejoonella antrihumi]TWP35115.1 hypothetical protein FGL98_15310 [Leekyejoonella antrihumi]